MRILDTTLAPGKRVSFDIPLVFRDRGCSGQGGGRITITGFPSVTVTSLRLSFERPAVDDLVHTQAGPARGCAS